MGIRREASTLGDGELRALRAAFARAYGIRDERGYGYFAGLHGLPLPNECPHNRPLFLPWHRAYLYLFERALQDLEPGADLPWWDWTTARSHREGLPAAYRRDPGRINRNPLSTGPVTLSAADLERFRDEPINQGALSDGPAPWTLRDPDNPDELPRAATIRRALDAPTFGDFTSLVEGMHNSVHGWVGGAMTLISVAAYDPIFWTHHAMIDRVWYLWQIGPRGRPPPEHLLDQALTPFPMTVRDTLSLTRLGYGYAVDVAG
ncbi:tyrosinase family protein [Actinoplanes sp. NPDC023936]|uniref:tyrosinase family protein n=1 Tax=Actinoplanes sp. NPDC023936 TaxID=3154910 RepID=UPI0033EC30C7